MNIISTVLATVAWMITWLRQELESWLFNLVQTLSLELRSVFLAINRNLKSGIQKVLHFILHDNIRGFISLYKLMEKSENDEVVNSLIDAFKLEFLDGGWEIVICINRSLWSLAILYGFFVLDENHPMKYRLTHTFPFVLCLFVVVDKISQKFKNTRELWMLFMNVMLSVICLKISLQDDKYVFNEMWLALIWQSHYSSMFMYWANFALYN